MDGFGAISNDSSNIVEELQEFYSKLILGMSVNEDGLFQIINNQKLSSKSEKLLEKIASHFRENKGGYNAFNIYKKLSLYSDKYFGKLVEFALLEGELFLAEMGAKKYLNYLVKKKNFKIGLKLIEELEVKGLGKDYISGFVLIFSAIRGDFKTFIKNASKVKFHYFSDSNYKLILEILNAISERDKNWKDLKEYKKFKTSKLFFMIKDVDNDSISLRQEFISLIFEYKILYPEDSFSIILLSQYAHLLNISPLKSTILDYLNQNKKMFTKEEYLKALEDFNVPIDKSLQRNQKDISKKVEKQDLSFLSKRKIYFKQLKNLSEDFYINERCMIKSCELLSDQTVLDYYEDLVVCFLVMGFDKVAISILDRIEKPSNKFCVKEKINLEFLKINILLYQKRYWEVLEKIEGLFLKFPLVPEERICFMYLKAEANYFSGKKDVAKKIYLEIKKDSPNYRLVENRLLNIEINK